jgi:O-antigen biosynthesis protein
VGRKTTKQLSIVITAWNNYKYSASCLSSIFKSTYPKSNYQIIFVDNASIDKTETLLTYLVEQGEPITYLKQSENFGFVKGNNLGWSITETPFVMLLNNDAFIDTQCIENMMNIIKSDNKIGAVGAQEYFLDGRPSKEKPYIFFKPKVLLDPELKSLQDLGYKDTIPNYVDVDIVGSACSIIRKSSVPEKYVFDERYELAHYDQEDLWMRIKRNGYRIVMPTYSANFQHIIAGTTRTNLPLYNEMLKINKQKFLDKWIGKV